MTKYEVIGYTNNGTYAEMVDAHDKDEALKLAKRSMKTWLPKGVKILKWVVRNY
jgi:hypothetical protein